MSLFPLLVVWLYPANTSGERKAVSIDAIVQARSDQMEMTCNELNKAQALDPFIPSDGLREQMFR